MKRLIAYIRGGLGDVWPAVCAIKSIIEKYNIPKFNVLIFTDSVYYFRNNYPKKLENYSLDMLRKISPNVIEISPLQNDNFNLTIDDTSDDFSQETADLYLNEFMFWRPISLKDYFLRFIDKDTIFIDSLCTECILQWDFENHQYKRVSDERAIIEFNPPVFEKNIIDKLLFDLGHKVVIQVRIREETNQTKFGVGYYNDLISFLNKNYITPILIGIDMQNLEGDYIDWREGNIGNNMLSFEGMGYLLSNCNIMIGDGSGLSLMKLYDQNQDNLLILNVSRWRTNWWDRAIKDKANYYIFDGTKEDNLEKIKEKIEEYFIFKNG